MTNIVVLVHDDSPKPDGKPKPTDCNRCEQWRGQSKSEEGYCGSWQVITWRMASCERFTSKTLTPMPPMPTPPPVKSKVSTALGKPVAMESRPLGTSNIDFGQSAHL